MKISEMDDDTTYILCPDKTCKLYWDTSQCIPRENNCPHQDRQIKLIICTGCQGLIELPGDHSGLCRVDHDCPDGFRASNFQRMSGKYFLLYEKLVNSAG